ncbi:MAG: AAA family ATPase [Sulfuritalea sp.]|nr:AAA family ATPase [Sulfuritalea sp.]
MRIENIHIRGFKRFQDLTVTNIPATAKLVLLTGPNGSGKTSLFEAFNFWMSFVRGQHNFEAEYHVRSVPDSVSDANLLLQNTQIQFHGTENVRNDPDRKLKAFYIRSAYRHEADFTTNGLSNSDEILNDSRRPQRLIHQEQRVSENYQRMVAESVIALYSDDSMTRQKKVSELADELIGEVREAMRLVFGTLLLEGPGNPMNSGTFRFKKGSSTGFHYKNLSGGEKAAFDLLLDFVVKRRAFDDTVYCIDEPELHMHTRLQSKLLEVMFDLVPNNCQLWLSTHSIGMARKAAELNATHPGQVAFIDFHDHDFDHPVTLDPIQPDRRFWRLMFHTALDDLAELVVPKYVVFCEGKRLGSGGRNPSFDAEVYRTIFSSHFPDVEFVPLGGTTEVSKDGKTFGLLLGKLAPGLKTWKVFDRDDRHESEIQQLQADGTQVLRRRDLESYLWDDEVLEALCTQRGQSEKAEELKSEKAAALYDGLARGLPADDIKAASGRLYNKCKQTLGITQCGDNAEAFARVTLAPLLVPSMSVYQELASIVMSPR